jgi:outer membrane receptor protein involved in Fe transport
LVASDPQTGEIAGELVTTGAPTGYEEYAAFADLTYIVTDAFNIQFGGRESRIKQNYSASESGPIVGPGFEIPEVNSDANVFTYLVTPQFKFSHDLMAYARFASGYRPGGPNPFPGNGTPPAYNPDKTRNYEIGMKGDFLDRTLTLDASIYFIDWDGIQIQLLNDQTHNSYNSNGGKARSDGVEISAESKPLAGLTLTAWGVYSDAVLTGAFPATSTAYGASGDRLPYSSRYSGNLSVQQDFALGSGFDGYVGADANYRSGWIGVFQATPERQAYSGYTTYNLRAGLKHNAWALNLFANNVADRRAGLVGGIDMIPPWAFYGIQPRTVGLNLVYELGGSSH